MKWNELRCTLQEKFPEHQASKAERLIHDDFDVELGEYGVGDDIELPPAGAKGRPWIGVVISGQVEVYEACAYGGDYGTYRPIRIIQQGEAFGLFSLADSFLAGRSTAVPKESWRVSAGPIATYLAYDPAERNNGHQPTYSSGLCDSVVSGYDGEGFWPRRSKTYLGMHRNQHQRCFYPHMLIHKSVEYSAHRPMITVVYVFIRETTQITRDDEYVKWAFGSLLSEMNAFRVCRNIYNDLFYTAIRNRVARKTKNSMTAEDKGVKSIHSTLLFSPFIEGISQAIDGYIHNDPMYYRIRWEFDTVMHRDHDYNEVTIPTSDLLRADHPHRRPGEDAFYPIGIANYHLIHTLLERSSNDNPNSAGDIAEIIHPKGETRGWNLYMKFADLAVTEYFNSYERFLGDRGLSDELSKAKALRPRVSVVCNLRGVKGDKSLALMIKGAACPLP